MGRPEGTRSRAEGTLSKAGLAALGVLSVVGFLPVLASSSVVIGVQSSAGAATPIDVAAPPAHADPAPRPMPDHDAFAVAVLEPEAPALPAQAPVPPAAPPAPELAPEPAPEPEPAPAPAPTPQPSVELVAVTPADPPAAGLVGLGGGLTTAAAPATALLPLPLVDEVVTPLLGGLLGGR